MPVIDPNDFWTQALSSLLAGILVLFVQPQWLVGLFRPKSDPSMSPNSSRNSNHGGNQLVITAESTIRGGIQQRNQYIDKSQQTTIITNIHAAATKRNSPEGDIWLQLSLAFVAAVVASGVFLLFRPLFMALSFGAAAGLCLMAIAAAVRSCRDLDTWPRQARLTLVVVPVATGVMVVTWISVSATARGSLSLDQVRAELPVSDLAASGVSLQDYFSEFFHRTVPAIVHMGTPTILFVFALLGGVLLALALVISAWFLVLDWHAYLRFTDSTDPGTFTTRRADAFTKRKVLPEIAVMIVIGAVALAFSSGLFYDLSHASQTQLTQPDAVSGK